FSLAASHKMGIAAVAGCFILFALASALWLPRRRPDFPTRSGLGWYMGVVVTFAAGTLVAVVVLAAEPKEKAEAAKPGPSTPTAPGQTTEPSPPKGHPVAGRERFVGNPRSSCHTFAPAKAPGNIEPAPRQPSRG